SKVPVTLKKEQDGDDDWNFAASLDQLVRGLQETGFRFGNGGADIGTYLNLLLAILVTLIPPAFIGYAKGSPRVFSFALIGLVIAVLFIHYWGVVYEDHRDTWSWLWLVFLATAGVSGFININRVSLLNFYRDRLADCYIIKRQADG